MPSFAEQARSEATRLLEALIRIRSPNPPGDEDRIVDLVEPYLADVGLHSIRVPLAEGRSSVVARVKGANPGSLVLCGHLDTVNADPSQWDTDPWTPHRRGDRLYGLGSADMKSGVAVLMTVVSHLARGSTRPPCDIVLALTADEERGYQGAASIAEAGLIDDARLLLIAEPTGGRAYIGQKGELWVECLFSGRAAHGSIPESGASALLPGCDFSLRLAEEAKRFPEIHGRGRTSLNVGTMQGGCQVNIVPDRARIELDLRVVSASERDRVVARIEELGRQVATEWKVEFGYRVINDRAPIVSPTEDPWIARFLCAHSETTSRAQPHEIAPYSTDAVAVVPRLQTPVIIYGPGRIEQAHQPNEYLELASLTEALDVTGRFVGLDGCCDRPEEAQARSHEDHKREVT